VLVNHIADETRVSRDVEFFDNFIPYIKSKYSKEV
jgi:hypothetical protein